MHPSGPVPGPHPPRSSTRGREAHLSWSSTSRSSSWPLAVVLLFVLPARQRKRMQAQTPGDAGVPDHRHAGDDHQRHARHGRRPRREDRRPARSLRASSSPSPGRRSWRSAQPLAAVDDERHRLGHRRRDRRTPAGRRHPLSRGTTVANRSLPAGRYFAAFLLIVAILYGLIYFTGNDPHAPARARPARRDDGHADRPHARRPGARAARTWSSPARSSSSGSTASASPRPRWSPRATRTSSSPSPGTTASRPASWARPRSCASGRSSAGPEPATPADGEPATDRQRGGDRPRGRADRRGRAHRQRRADRRRRADRAPPRRARRRGRRPRPDTDRPAGHPGGGRRRVRDAHLRHARRPATVDRPEDYVAACSEDGTAKYLLGPAVVEGTAVTDASAGTRAGTGEWIVSSTSTTRARRPGRRTPPPTSGSSVGITLDGRVISAPIDQRRHPRRQTEITGSFDQESADRAGQPAEVRRPAADLHPGHRPVDLDRARRGAAAGRPHRRRHRHRAGLRLRAGLLPAARAGDDRQPGALRRSSSTPAWCCWAGRSGSRSASPASPGSSSSLGITADSFVVYFERLKDEIREGRSLRSARARGPGSAPGGRSSRPTRSASWPRRSSTCSPSAT